jgi:translation initiation factor 3 subunit A
MHGRASRRARPSLTPPHPHTPTPPPPAQLIPGVTFNEAEAQLVDAVKYGFLSMRIDHRNGTLQFGGAQLESDRVAGHLKTLAASLAKAAAMIDPRPATGRAEEARRAAIALCRSHMESEHKRLLARKLLIEKRKEQQEAALLEAEREEERKRQQVRPRGRRAPLGPEAGA